MIPNNIPKFQNDAVKITNATELFVQMVLCCLKVCNSQYVIVIADMMNMVPLIWKAFICKDKKVQVSKTSDIFTKTQRLLGMVLSAVR